MILLTGFKGNNNSSKILLDAINCDNVNKKLLTNTFASCEREIIDAISLLQPKFVISFGRKPVINRLYIEPIACNNDEFIRSTFDVSILEQSLAEHDLKYRLSANPSHYLCNHAYYAGLNYIEKNKLETKMIFIHVPDMKNIQDMELLVSWLIDLCGGINELYR